MKNILQIIPAILFWGLIQSCQKRDTTAYPVVPPVITDDSVVRLSKLVFFDPAVSATDTSSVDIYAYDSQGRVTGINGYDYPDGSPELAGVITYYYSGTDSMPYKSVSEEVGFSSDTTFYFYDGSQRLIGDSTVSIDFDLRKTTATGKYTYPAGMIVATGASGLDNEPVTFTSSDTGFTGSTGDVTKTVSTQLGTTNNITSYFSYDNHINPFYLLNIRSVLKPVPDFGFGIYGDYLQKNNVTSVTVENLPSSQSSFTVTYTYTYNESGLPATADVLAPGGQTVEERLVYVYKKL